MRTILKTEIRAKLPITIESQNGVNSNSLCEKHISVSRTGNWTELFLVFDTELQAFALSETGKTSTVII